MQGLTCSAAVIIPSLDTPPRSPSMPKLIKLPPKNRHPYFPIEDIHISTSSGDTNIIQTNLTLSTSESSGSSGGDSAYTRESWIPTRWPRRVTGKLADDVASAPEIPSVVKYTIVSDSNAFPRLPLFSYKSSDINQTGPEGEDFGLIPSDSTALFLYFPSVNPSVLRAVVGHTLDPDDVYLLGESAEPGYNPDVLERYSTLASLIQPLATYFQILVTYASTYHPSSHLATSKKHPQASSSTDPATSPVLLISRASLTYITHITQLSGTYPWRAVLRYHMAFHKERMAEMREGNYDGWARCDERLMRIFINTLESKSR
ncbi:hypothetical protein K474DRAFT_708208 [Panus rudis PR-1116 ss-1]|nr:hypothetical protein K474DRAFT_708208 [Panus rudis PR-1116 ss-1]